MAEAAEVHVARALVGEDALDGSEIERAVLPALAPHARDLYARDGIAEDELVEVTPKSIRVRKRVLKQAFRPKRKTSGA